MNIKKNLKKELRSLSTPTAERVLPISVPKHTRHTVLPRRSVTTLLLTALLSLLLIVGSVAAVPEIIKRLNAPQLNEQSYGLTQVPNGWIGIDTLDGLSQLNDPKNKNAKFILMNDIEIPNEAYEKGGIYENGFLPLGCPAESASDGFSGSFNGNGHVIRNLKLGPPCTVRDSRGAAVATVGLFGYTSAKITYLGIENVEIVYTQNEAVSQTLIGSLAAKADFIGGCYVQNLRLQYNANAASSELIAIGGMSGYAQYLDSCYVNRAELSVRDGGTGKTALAGGIVGSAHSVVTSYFCGKVALDATGYASATKDPIAAMPYAAYTPILLSDSSMQQLLERLAASLPDGTDDFSYKKLKSYYVEQNLDKLEASDGNTERAALIRDYLAHLEFMGNAFYTEQIGRVRCWYELANNADPSDILMLSELLVKAFGSNEAFSAFCTENNVKCGKLFCYAFDSGQTPSSTDLPAFDFEQIWTTTENGVVLKAFA